MECTKPQLVLLHLHHPVRHKTFTGHIMQALRSYPFLQFYKSLKAAQREKAFSESGLSVIDMSITQRAAYVVLIHSGTPRRSPARLKLQKSHFYVLPSFYLVPGRPRRDVLDFTVTDPNDGAWCRMGAL